MATWKDVVDALDALERRQSSLQQQLAKLPRQRQDLMGLQLNYAARLAVLQRQNEALASQARRAQRPRSAPKVRLVEGEGLAVARTELRRSRAECAELRARLGREEERGQARQARLARQEALLREAEEALQGVCRVRPMCG